MSHRHAMVVHAYYPVGETRVQRETAALVREGVHVDVICLRRPGERWHEVVEGATVLRVPLGRHRGRGVMVQLLEYLAFMTMAGALLTARHARRRFDSVQVHNLPDFLVFAALVPRLTGARILLDLHDLMPEFLAARLGVAPDHPLVRLVVLQERLACRVADAVITVTDGWKDRLVERGISADKVTVVMNVADPELFAPRRDPEPGDGTFTILYHGTFTVRYGVDLLVEACARIEDRIPSWRLCLLGDGEARPELEAAIERLGLGERVQMSPGMLTVQELRPYLLRADVGVIPNRSSVFTDDLLPTKLLEYVATGIPVVAARTPMIEAYFDDEMVEFFEPGNPADLADRLVDLAGSVRRRSLLTEASRRFSDDHSWDRVRKTYTELVLAEG